MSIRKLVWAAQAEAAVAFGAMLKRWRELQGWTQYTAIDWAEQASEPFASAPHSGLSELETGKTRHPRAPLFLYLGEMNRRIAAKDFHGVHTRKTLDQLKGSVAITDEAGNPWGPAEFWSCFAGILPIPDWLQPVPVTPVPQLTADAAADLGESWRERIIAIGQAAGMRPMVALREFAKTCPAAAREVVEDGLAAGFEPGSMGACWDPRAGEWGPEKWLSEWSATLSDRDPAESGDSGRNSELNGCGSA